MIARERSVCPVENAGHLDNFIRRWLQNPKKILEPFIKPGMSVMDYGCGPGFFTVDMAKMVGPTGRVFAVDIQEGMLEKLNRKLLNTDLADRIQPHLCQSEGIRLSERIDFVLAFYVIHEIPGQEMFFREIVSMLKPGGSLLMVEPPFHVTKSAFKKSIALAEAAGLQAEPGPRLILNKTSLLRKAA